MRLYYDFIRPRRMSLQSGRPAPNVPVHSENAHA